MCSAFKISSCCELSVRKTHLVAGDFLWITGFAGNCLHLPRERLKPKKPKKYEDCQRVEHKEAVAIIAKVRGVNVGIIGLGNVGSGALEILAENAKQIQLKLGFPLRVAAVCSRSVQSLTLPPELSRARRVRTGARLSPTLKVDIVAELIGGTAVAREVIDAAIDQKKSVVTANKELMAVCGAEIWDARDQGRDQSGDGSERRGRHPHSRRAAGGDCRGIVFNRCMGS